MDGWMGAPPLNPSLCGPGANHVIKSAAQQSLLLAACEIMHRFFESLLVIECSPPIRVWLMPS